MTFLSKVRLALLVVLPLTLMACDWWESGIQTSQPSPGFDPPVPYENIYGQYDPAAVNRPTIVYEYYPTIDTYYNRDYDEYTFRNRGEWVRSRTPPLGLLPDSTGFEEIKIRGGEPELYQKDIEKDYPADRQYPHRHHYDPNHITPLTHDDQDDNKDPGKPGDKPGTKPDEKPGDSTHVREPGGPHSITNSDEPAPTPIPHPTPNPNGQAHPIHGQTIQPNNAAPSQPAGRGSGGGPFMGR